MRSGSRSPNHLSRLRVRRTLPLPRAPKLKPRPKGLMAVLHIVVPANEFGKCLLARIGVLRARNSIVVAVAPLLLRAADGFDLSAGLAGSVIRLAILALTQLGVIGPAILTQNPGDRRPSGLRVRRRTLRCMRARRAPQAQQASTLSWRLPWGESSASKDVGSSSKSRIPAPCALMVR